MNQELPWVRKPGIPVMKEAQAGEVRYLQFPLLLKWQDVAVHGFSTRLGGASRGVYASMNFSFSRGDDPDCVRENYRRMGEALGVDPARMVLSYQTHTTRVRRVGEEDAGKGVLRERDYRDVDGLITDVPGITLVTFYADCVPLYFLDPVHRAIGLSHSGWRGTVNRMGRETLAAMKQAFGSRPEDMLCCIGPSICQDCYEVGEEVAQAFAGAFGKESETMLIKTETAGKYRLDLWKANETVLREAGVPREQIQVTDLCTRCNPRYLFSHRAMGEKRGNLAAFLCLRPQDGPAY